MFFRFRVSSPIWIFNIFENIFACPTRSISLSRYCGSSLWSATKQKRVTRLIRINGRWLRFDGTMASYLRNPRFEIARWIRPMNWPINWTMYHRASCRPILEKKMKKEWRNIRNTGKKPAQHACHATSMATRGGEGLLMWSWTQD